jgi:hypothetical protein
MFIPQGGQIVHTEAIDPKRVFLRLYTEAIAANESVGLVDRRRQQAERHGASDDEVALACQAGFELLDTRRKFPSIATATTDDALNCSVPARGALGLTTELDARNAPPSSRPSWLTRLAGGDRFSSGASRSPFRLTR